MSSPATPPRPSAVVLGPWVVLGAMALLYAVSFSWQAVLRHLAFQSHAFDLGNMDQAVWATLHGMPLRFTDMQVGSEVLTNRLAIHVEPILLPISLLYLLHSGPETLLVLQAVVVATGAIPAYLLAQDVLRRRWLALVFPAAYLLHPSLQNALLDDFHAVTMSAALLLWALYFLWARRVGPFLVMGVLAAATKEEVALLVGLLGIVLLFRRRRVLGIAVLLGGLLWFLAALVIVIPHFNPAGHSPYLGRYSYLGHGLGGIVTGIAHHPGLVAQTLLSRPRLLYLNALLDPLGFLPALGLPVLLLAVPTVAINMFSADPTMYSGYYQYSAELVPYLIAAAIFGVRAAARAGSTAWAGRLIPAVLCVLLAASAVLACVREGFTPFSAGYTVPSAGAHQQLESTLLGQIPPGAVVAAGDEIEPHLSNRRTAYLLPTVHPSNGPRARFIVLDASVPSLPVRPSTLHAVAARAMRHGYGVRAARDGILILEAGAIPRRLPSGFYSFLFSPARTIHHVHVRSGPLTLVGVAVHPSYGWINRARPAIEVESYWRASTRPSRRWTIGFAVSTVYSGQRPSPPPARAFVGDTPAAAWLPFDRWPAHRTIRVASLPLLPSVDRPGKVDVYLRVACTARAGAPASCPRNPGLVRLTTVSIRAPD